MIIFHMDSALVDNEMRKKILLTLKKKGSMSVGDLSKEINITTMGVRQHLHVLERNGVVEYIIKKHGIGRPSFIYRLTDVADDLFPKVYQVFALDVLRDLEETNGRDSIDGIFKRRNERTLKEKMRVLSEKDSLSDRLYALAGMLDEDGCMVELEENDRSFKLKQFNCPILKIASNFREACNYDLQLFKALIGEDVIRQQCLSDGANACVYIIPKPQTL